MVLIDFVGRYKSEKLRAIFREWQGVRHGVEVTRDGFLHAGKRYRSLSQVARAITGTRWSGPRFFGLPARAEPPKP